MRFIHISLWLLMLVAISYSSGCATLTAEHTQLISITSSPSGAPIFVDGNPRGNTPASIEMERRENHMIQVSGEIYEPHLTYVKKVPTRRIAGNLLGGGIIGFIVDILTEASNDLDPPAVHARLRKRRRHDCGRIYQRQKQHRRPTTQSARLSN